jgi:SAM-dependent methyltransferase
MRRVLGAHPGATLLLGVTPELAGIAPSVTAVDRSEAMIRGVWPGDTATRRAVNANWFELPFERGTFAVAVGDGSLNALPYPDGHVRLHGELARVLEPGGRVVIRAFCRPDSGEPLKAVFADASLGRIGTFHAFKWRYAMALAAKARSPNLAVRTIHAVFTAAVPDREEFARQTGWDSADIDTIDVYRTSDEVYSFPTRDELRRAVPSSFARAELLDAGNYELAERCPLLVLEREREREREESPGPR